MKTTKEERKFELCAKLVAMGFLIHEALELLRIEQILRRWSKMVRNGDTTQREANKRTVKLLKRLHAISDTRNLRDCPSEFMRVNAQDWVFHYHTDKPDCALYLITRGQLGKDSIESAYNRGLAVCY